jgi:hypothetical protein
MLTEGPSGEPERPAELGPHAFELDLSFAGPLDRATEERLDHQVIETGFLEVRRSYRILVNRGAGGAGLVLIATLVAEWAGSALVGAAAIAAFKKAYQLVIEQVIMPHLKILIKGRPDVTYRLYRPGEARGIEEPELTEALDAVPADYERTTTETVKVWKDGRWERVVTETSRGGTG